MSSSTFGLPPANRHQRRRNLLHPPLRRQEVELRPRIPRILHINPDPQRIDIPSRLGRNRERMGPKSQYQ